MAAEWERHKGTIRLLYLSRDESLKDVMAFMKKEHAFEKSKGQYERQLDNWKFRKIARGELWKCLHDKVDRRCKGRKAASVYANGRLVPKEKLAKEKRHYFPGPMELYQAVSITCNLVSPKTAHGEVPSKGQLLKAEALVVASRFSWLLELESVNTIYDTLSQLDFEARHSSETTQLRMANFFDSRLQSNSTRLLRRIVYLASNNMLSEFSAQKLLQEIYQSKDYNLFKTLLSGQSLTMKALARTFLLTGIVTSDVRLARVCLGTGMNLNSFIGNPPKRALAMAVEKARFELVHLLLQNGADVNAPASGNPGRTALQATSEQGSIELVGLLLFYGANVNARPAGQYGITALQAASGNGNIELVKLLLDVGAGVNAPAAEQDGRTALQAASEQGSIELAELLLAKGADVNAPAAEQIGRTALQAASEQGSIEFVRLLLESGADVNARPAERYGRTALQAASVCVKVEIVRLLLRHGADVDSPPSTYAVGATAVQSAAEAGLIGIVYLLLESGAYVHGPTAEKEGRTALEGAAEHGRLDIVQLLLNMGAETQGSRASHFAQINGHEAIVLLLHEHRV
ncbi:hypothetical protein LTR56_027096 [Elasticomyces elasticus]|nr:hypothetical protein LTR56_027096 [Elasticomyces elasticus]KAK3615597.1 hypothetical protein LTR22_027373 [Elasticomyces elasticus]